MATEEEVFLYLDDLQEYEMSNLIQVHSRVMRLFDLPPHRVSLLIDQWLKQGRSNKPTERSSHLTTRRKFKSFSLRRHPWDTK